MADTNPTSVPAGTLLTRILLGASAQQTAGQLQAQKKVAAVPDLAPAQVNTVRVLLVVIPNTIDALESVLAALRAACAPAKTTVRNDDHTTYGLADFGAQTIAA
jgi:hypothetical protein